jgi:hypothetical protein
VGAPRDTDSHLSRRASEVHRQHVLHHDGNDDGDVDDGEFDDGESFFIASLIERGCILRYKLAYLVSHSGRGA